MRAPGLTTSFEASVPSVGLAPATVVSATSGQGAVNASLAGPAGIVSWNA